MACKDQARSLFQSLSSAAAGTNGVLPQSEGSYLITGTINGSGTAATFGPRLTVPSGFVFVLTGYKAFLKSAAMADIPAASAMLLPSGLTPTMILDVINFSVPTDIVVFPLGSISAGGNSGQSFGGGNQRIIVPANFSVLLAFQSSTGTAYTGNVAMMGYLLKDENFPSQKGAFTI